HDASGTHLRLVRILPELAESASLAEQVPALVELDLDGLQAMVVGGGERLLAPEAVLLLHQILDVLADGGVEVRIAHERLLFSAIVPPSRGAIPHGSAPWNTGSPMSMPQALEGRSHSFVAVAYVDDLPVSWMPPLVKEPKTTPHELRAALPERGEVFAFPFGALVFRDVEPKVRDALLASLHARHPRLVPDLVREEFAVFERPGARVGLAEGR